jgi:hypothetical protein
MNATLTLTDDPNTATIVVHDTIWGTTSGTVKRISEGPVGGYSREPLAAKKLKVPFEAFELVRAGGFSVDQ